MAFAALLALVLVLTAGWAWTTHRSSPSPSEPTAPAVAGSAPAPASDTDAEGDPAPSTAPDGGREEDVRVAQRLVVLGDQTVLLAETVDGNDPEVAAFAERLIGGPDPDHQALVDWLGAQGADVPDGAAVLDDLDSDPAPDLPAGITSAQLADLERARGTDADRLFLGLLLSHDDAVLSLVDRLDATSGDDGLRGVADAMAGARSARVARATAMLDRLV